MNMAMQQAVYKSTIVLINLIFQKGMRAVDQKLKINLVWPNALLESISVLSVEQIIVGDTYL